MFKVAIFEKSFKDMTPFREELGERGELTELENTPETQYGEEVRHCDGLIIVNQKAADRDYIDTLENCKIIVRSGVGYDNVDAEYAASKGIYVANVPNYCDDEVSDHAVAMLLALERRLFKADSNFRDTRRYRLDAIRGISGLRGKTVGIIGLGATGKLTAKKMTAFGMNVIYYHPRRHNDVEGDGFFAKWCDLDELYENSDYVVLHATSNAETFHIVDEHALKLMKKTAGLVNVARGELVDTVALNKALDEGEIACCALDVFEGSLKLDHNRELFEKPNTILTPHSAWLSENAEIRLQQIMADNFADVAEGRAPRNCVNLKYMKKQ